MANGDDTNLMTEPVEEVAGEGVGYAGGVAVQGYAPSVGQGSYNDASSEEIGTTALPLGGSLSTPGMAAVYAEAPSVAQEDVNLSTGAVNWGSSGNFFSNLLSGIGKFLGGGGGGTVTPASSSSYYKNPPATTASTVAATVKKNWLPIVALAIVAIVGAVLLFRRKR